MASQSTIFRKVFVDSRYRSSGSHADFEIELPRDVSTTRTSSVYLASCSFSNTFETILQGVNDRFYFLRQNLTAAPYPEPSSLFLYGRYRRDRSLSIAVGQSQWIYFVSHVRREGRDQYALRSAQLTQGTYNAVSFAVELTRALRASITERPDPNRPEVGNDARGAWFYSYRMTSADAAVQYWLLADEDIPSVMGWLAPNIVRDTRDAPWPIRQGQTANWSMNMPALSPPGPEPFPYGRMFPATAVGGEARYNWPILYFRYNLNDPPLDRPVSFERMAARLQGVLRDAFPGMVVTTQNRQFSYNLGRPDWVMQLVSDTELRDPAWRAANWQYGPEYDTSNPKSYNQVLQIAAPSSLVVSYTTPPLSGIDSFTYAVPPGQYDGPGLALTLQGLLRRAVASAAVAFDGVAGTMTFTVAAPDALQLPTERELRNQNWRSANWDPYPHAGLAPINWLSPESTNGQLFLPSPSRFLATTTSGNIDLVPFREVYLASSITNYRTLQAGTAAQDIMARIPIDVPYGQIVVYRHLGPSDALAASDMSFRTVRFTFRDWAGRVAPIDQPTIIELAFLDSDQYSM